MGQAFGQQQQQPFGGMGGVPPAAMAQQPTVNPTNPFNAGAAGFPQMPQQQQQQQQPQPTGPSFDLSDEFLGLGAKKQEEPPAADPFRVATPASSAGEPVAAAGDDAGFGQGSARDRLTVSQTSVENPAAEFI